MDTNIEKLKIEVDEIKNSLNALKNDVTLSKVEKKNRAETLKNQAENTKQKIEKIIESLKDKTDEVSQKNKEEAETLLRSLSELTDLYKSILNWDESVSHTESQRETRSENVFSKTWNWISNQWNDMWDKEKWNKEWWKNILRTVWFAATWIWAISLAYKWIKKLFWWWKDNDDKDNHRENESETWKSEENWDKKRYREALKWLWIASATWWWVYFLNRWIHSRKKEDDKKKDEEKKDKKSEDKKEKGDYGVTEDWLDREKKTYTNPKSGLTFCIYDQADPRRWNKMKNGGTTMNQTGCLLTSAAVIDSVYNPSHTPDYYRQHYAGRFPYDSIPKASGNKLQSEVLLPGENNKWPKEKTQRAITEMIKNLEKWYPVNFMVHWPRHGGSNTLTTWQHYMTAVDVRENDGGKEVFIANTHNGKWLGRFSVDKAFASLRQASLYTPTKA